MIHSGKKRTYIKWNQVVWPPGAANTVSPRSRARTQLHRPLKLAVAVDTACSIGVTILKFVGLLVR